MAKRYKLFEAGTPQRKLQDALAARYDNAEQFFAELARALTIRQDSASGTFYGFLSGTRALPAGHRAQYLQRLGIDGKTLDEIDSSRSVTTPERRDRLAELAVEVEDLAKALRQSKQAAQLLARRVSALEAAAGSAPAARPGTGSTRRGRSGR